MSRSAGMRASGSLERRASEPPLLGALLLRIHALAAFVHPCTSEVARPRA